VRKVVKTDQLAEIHVKDANRDRIYVTYSNHSKKYYKLHELSLLDHNLFAFVSLHDSVCFLCGTDTDMSGMLCRTLELGNTVYEFSDIREFITWMKDALGC
jgi:hypothetical protein